MADRLQFKEKLAGVLALAEDQNGKITVDEVEKYFEEDGLSQEQMNLVCDHRAYCSISLWATSF